MGQHNHIHPVKDGVTFHNRNHTRGSRAKSLTDLIDALSVAVDALQAVDAQELDFVDDVVDFYAEVTRFETRMITQALRLAAGSQRKAAELLNLNPNTLNSKIKAYHIDWKANRSFYSSRG